MTKKWMLLLFLLFSICSASFGASPNAAEAQLAFWNDIPGFLNQQHAYSLVTVEELLEKYPPTLGESLERCSAFFLLDNVFHDPEAKNYESVQQFFIRRTRIVANALQEVSVTEGMHIWKLYNHGFIVRTSTATIAFDLVSGKHIGSEGFCLPEDVVEVYANQCDALFISHLHLDHADENVAQAFISKGKPVVVPENLWQKESFSNKLSYLERSADKVHSLPVQDGKKQLEVVIYPGHQGMKLLNNVTLVRMSDDITVVHTGDQSNLMDFTWIDAISENHQVDILLPNCWTTDMPRMIAGVDPAVVITGHENELGHSIDHREPYWLNAARIGDGITRYVAMTWGESFVYRKVVK